ncbi:Aprataxin-like protein [Diplogelasinospora grovesii]|uniref:Aprataxin-like protein n=1 Tax=Diplogelasinospora grovesii TaxID=303347 RepID=A0AAN6ND90_9PEZI|nr:Aprataxin-like protein [Diplogelasinospora grovesii]
MAEPAEDLDDGKDASSKPQKRNAFAELMAPKPKVAKSDSKAPPSTKASAKYDRRDELLSYIQNPESFPRGQVVLRVTPDTVLIRDLYPKATIHLLLLPRSPAHHDLHPHGAFEDPKFLSMMKEEAASAARLAAAELSRQLSQYSATSSKTMEGDEDSEGRDYSKEIRVGIHAHPSMRHLHVHIISRDMHSASLKHKKHYNSFNTPFFIPLADYPLSEDDERRETGYQNANLKGDMVCWRCGQNFGNRFADLKKHLDVEFEQWKKE